MAASIDTMPAATRALIIAIVAVFVGSAIIGIWRVYSPIPMFDDWGNYLGFYADLLDGRYSAWFADYSGHRTVLPRALMWLDIRYFGGRFVFLIIANLLMLGAIVAVLIAGLRRLTPDPRLRLVVGATICVGAVSWLQANNLAGGHAGANWFMAVLLPLLACFALARAKAEPKVFWLALLAGFASAWTLANGLLVLPLLAGFALAIGLNPARIALLAIAAATAIALYFDFFSGAQGPLLAGYWSALTGDPVSAVQYVLAFLGSPFFDVVSYPLAMLQYLRQGGAAGPAPRPDFGGNLLTDYPDAFALGSDAAQAAGAAFVVVAIILARRWLASEREPTSGALLTFVAFIIATAAAGAAARPGIHNSFGPEFLTAALLAWLALAVLAAPSLSLPRALGIFACTAILLLPSQLLPVLGLRRIADTHARRQQAMQAILQGSDDPATLAVLDADPAVVRRLRGTKVSIFADGP